MNSTAREELILKRLESLERKIEEFQSEFQSRVRCYTRTPAFWTEIRSEAARAAGNDPLLLQKVIAVVSAILRIRFGVRHIQNLKEEQAPEAIEIAREALKLMGLAPAGEGGERA
ncbi:hypothetical protein DXX99_09215 [Ammonifex thiophilus]|uniref:Uncharacterized protein n=1 Tax=Ammonifex thiophilus TaxID=444093 RepID=A0A3D8P390_9THEO|nr:hypothetical protein DXX99_09215 [Ammonifex thiophilus]